MPKIRTYKTVLHFSYGCEMQFLILREENELQVFGYKSSKIFGPTRDEVTEYFTMLCNEEFCYLYRSASIIGAKVAQSVQLLSTGWMTDQGLIPR
jgi:hypothetical protein